MTDKELIETLNWRYAAKRMTGEKLSSEQLGAILEAIRLAPSSMGLQPYRVIVNSSDVIRDAIAQKACTQPQVKESSHFLVFAVWTDFAEAQVDAYMDHIALQRGVLPETLAGFRRNIVNLLNSRTAEQNTEWAARQAYIGLGFGLNATAQLRVDATPMEGFDQIEMDKVLGLDRLNLHSVVMLALGYRDAANDKLVHAAKVRVPHDEFFTFR